MQRPSLLRQSHGEPSGELDADRGVASASRALPLRGPDGSQRVSPLELPEGFEERAIETARRALEDVPECAGASYSVSWLAGQLPILVLEFAQFAQRGASPACAVALMTVRRGTLADPLPGKTLLAGQRLTDTVLSAVHTYLHRSHPGEIFRANI
jgi:hypothetical protein